jgi:multidrug efflux pump subunit AcrA (membrane-fusion protein)
MNQQQFGQMQADMAAMQALMQQQQVALQQAQGQVVNAQAIAVQAQADAQQAQAANAAQAVIVGQQQLALVAAQALAAQAVADAATAQAAADVAAAVIPGGGNAIAPAVNAPGQIVGLINLESTNGLKIHKSASAPLRDLFDGQASKITTFINDVGTRARSFGWDALIFTVNTAEHGVKNMLENYSSITMADISAMADIYSGTLPIATRASQAATQCHLMLQESLSPALKARVIARRAEYTFTVNNSTYEDGVAMLKVVFNLVSVDTKATVSVINRNLEYAQLASKLVELEYDPIRFHLFVHEQLLKLAQRNSAIPNIVGALFEAYKQTPDDAFASWASFEYGVWEKPTSDDWSNEQVMNFAEEKYHTIVQKGEWKVPTKQSEEIIALTARLDQAEASLKKRKLDQVASGSTPRKRPAADGDNDKFAWKNVAPAAGEPQEKTVGKKIYVHCPHHGELKWVLKSGHAGGCNKAPAGATSTPTKVVADPSVVTAVVTALAGIANDAE